MNTFRIVLEAHSGFRWLALLLAIVLVIKSLIGLTSKSSYQKLDNTLAVAFVGMMHLQAIIGLILYFFLSPITTNAIKNMKWAMKVADIRFWAVEHGVIMIAAIAFAQIGRSISKKATSNPAKFKKQLIFFGISLACMLVGIPWDRVFG
jgi:F0F1-type ATP synthase membrane subunit c/vacuolar-type H+-ATPase subunit K